jgi:glycerophosphoryl diester phosphodiesterase
MKPFIRRPLLVILMCLFATVSANADETRPLVVAHRGLLRNAPENTLSNFRACLELRLGFEFDVRRTKDGRLVAIHDDTVDRTTDGSGAVSDLSFHSLRQLDAGSWFDPRFAGETIPTIDEVLQLMAQYPRHEVLVTVDLKAEGVEEEVVRLAQKHQVLGRLLFIGRTISEPAVRQTIRRTSKEAHVATLANTAAEFAPALADDDSHWVYLRYLPSPDEMAAVRKTGKRAFIAGPTVSGNVPENWRRAAGTGIDGILTDYPLELAAALREAK